jgi:transcriptional regulator GlxA family with amidase domain
VAAAAARRGDPLLVSVCTGAEVLAVAGLLDGRPATSHWLGLIGLRRDYPAVRWTDGVRYVDDGDVITTAGVLSGIDGALTYHETQKGRCHGGLRPQDELRI